MNITEFIKTIYLGDRTCKAVIINSQENVVKIQVDVISRIRDTLYNWNFYNDENIEDGFIVFSDVEHICFEPKGLIPNGYINMFQLEKYLDDEEINGRFKFEIHIGSYSKKGEYDEVVITVIAKGLYLEDPLKPDVAINE